MPFLMLTVWVCLHLVFTFLLLFFSTSYNFDVLVLQTEENVVGDYSQTSQNIVPSQRTSNITEEHSQASECG